MKKQSLFPRGQMGSVWVLIFVAACSLDALSAGAEGTSISGNDADDNSAGRVVVTATDARPTSDKTDGVLPLGILDKGIFDDFNSQVSLHLPPPAKGTRVSAAVNKARRVLTVMYDNVPVKSYPVALGFTPVGDKKVEGDGKTPEGTYLIVEKRSDNLPGKYGARSMLLNYPSVKDGKRGLRQKRISKETYQHIVTAVEKDELPPQDTGLGSSIRIHGGGVQADWTAGCIALRDEDVVELYRVLPLLGEVKILSDQAGRKQDRDRDGIPNQVDVSLGAVKADLNDASYDGAFQRIGYPNGDVPRSKGVCTDVVIRAFRNAGLDLQQEIHRHIAAHPEAYPNITNPSTHIDHRRVKNMLVYMKSAFRKLPIDGKFLPGDVVFFDTLPKSGPDHVGIVSSRTGQSGHPLIINNWTDGAVTDAMDLLLFVPVTHHFRW